MTQVQAMGETWWFPIVKWGLWAIVMSVVMAWFARARGRPAPLTPRGVEVRLTKPFLALGLICAFMFGAFAVLSYGSSTGGPGVAAFFVLFALLGCYLTYAYFAARYAVSPDGLAHYRLHRSWRLAPWSHVQHVRYGRFAQWFVVRLQDRTVLRISATSTGLQAFAEAILSRVDPEAIDPDCLDVLRAAALGDLPRIW